MTTAFISLRCFSVINLHVCIPFICKIKNVTVNKTLFNQLHSLSRFHPFIYKTVISYKRRIIAARLLPTYKIKTFIGAVRIVIIVLIYICEVTVGRIFNFRNRFKCIFDMCKLVT